MRTNMYKVCKKYEILMYLRIQKCWVQCVFPEFVHWYLYWWYQSLLAIIAILLVNAALVAGRSISIYSGGLCSLYPPPSGLTEGSSPTDDGKLCVGGQPPNTATSVQRYVLMCDIIGKLQWTWQSRHWVAQTIFKNSQSQAEKYPIISK